MTEAVRRYQRQANSRASWAPASVGATRDDDLYSQNAIHPPKNAVHNGRREALLSV
jgi:hypothetical protein